MAWLARNWADALTATGCATAGGMEFESVLRSLADKLHSGLWSEPFELAPAYVIGEFLADQCENAVTALDATVSLVGRLLPMLPAKRSWLEVELATRVDLLQGAISAGYVERLHAKRVEPAGASVGYHASWNIVATERSYENWFRAVFLAAGTGMAISSLDGKFIEVNQAAADLFGCTVDEVLTLNWGDLLDADTASASLSAYRALIDGDVRYIQMEQHYRRRDGAEIWTNLTASLIRDDNGVPLFTVAMVEDITEARLLREQLRHQASHDPLTGLPNRTLFFERLADALRRETGGSDVGVGLCYLDLDRFKSVNDTLGHSVGDQLLVAVAERLQDRIAGPGRLIARMGGDEFVILVEDSGMTGAVAVAELALDALSRAVFVGGNRFCVSASIGVVERSDGRSTPEDLMAAADMTLYWAKSQGRGRYEIFDAERSSKEASRIALATDLPDALQREEFQLEYQPLVSLEDGRMVGVEALVRWHHPHLGVVPPGEFIGLAEETGAIVELGRWVLAEACHQAAEWARRFPGAGGGDGLLVSVNLAARQIRDSAIVEDVKALLDRSGLPARLLQLELTENEIMGTASRPLEELEELAAIGIGIAIDDFGTGYSNLSYLRRLPVSSIKVDKSFVDGLDKAHDLLNHDDVAAQEKIFGTIVSLAHALNLKVTAEGVESAAQADRVRGLGCDSGQGWLFGRPCTAERITHALEAGVSAFSPQASAQ